MSMEPFNQLRNRNLIFLNSCRIGIDVVCVGLDPTVVVIQGTAVAFNDGTAFIYGCLVLAKTFVML